MLDNPVDPSYISREAVIVLAVLGDDSGKEVPVSLLCSVGAVYAGWQTPSQHSFCQPCKQPSLPLWNMSALKRCATLAVLAMFPETSGCIELVAPRESLLSVLLQGLCGHSVSNGADMVRICTATAQNKPTTILGGGH